jgi:hypothetical protein
MSDDHPSSASPAVTKSWFWALAGIVVSLPAALGLETLLRHELLPANFEQMRLLLAPVMTPLAWLCVIVAVPIDVLALLLHRQLWARAAARHTDPQEVSWKRFEGLMISASVAQVPGLAAVFLYMMGAGLSPVLWSLCLSTLGVVSIGAFMR